MNHTIASKLLYYSHKKNFVRFLSWLYYLRSSSWSLSITPRWSNQYEVHVYVFIRTKNKNQYPLRRAQFHKNNLHEAIWDQVPDLQKDQNPKIQYQHHRHKQGPPNVEHSCSNVRECSLFFENLNVRCSNVR